MKLPAAYQRGLTVFGGEDDGLQLHAYEGDEYAHFEVARGDSFLDDGEASRLKSELPDVDDERWTQFVHVMATAPLSSVSLANDLGMFELRPRRLEDLGVVKKVQRARSPEDRTIWVAVFVPPLTCEEFLRSPQQQYRVFSSSMRDYADKMQSGEIERDQRTSISGALAILHRAGPRGLESWRRGDRHPDTEKLFTRVQGVF